MIFKQGTNDVAQDAKHLCSMHQTLGSVSSTV